MPHCANYFYLNTIKRQILEASEAKVVFVNVFNNDKWIIPTEYNLSSCVNLIPVSRCFHGNFSVTILALAQEDKIPVLNVSDEALIGSIISLTRGGDLPSLSRPVKKSEMWAVIHRSGTMSYKWHWHQTVQYTNRNTDDIGHALWSWQWLMQKLS